MRMSSRPRSTSRSRSSKRRIPELVGAHAVIWTTTPWTIPVNQAIAYGPELIILLFNLGRGSIARKHLVRFNPAAKTERSSFRGRLRLELMFGETKPFGSPPTTAKIVLEAIKGSDLAGAIARHPMHQLGGFFAKPRPFLPGDFVTTDAGTGLVHMAPDHGEDDFLLCKANGIDPVFAVDGGGMYRADWLWLGGQGSVINPSSTRPTGRSAPTCATAARCSPRRTTSSTAIRTAGGPRPRSSSAARRNGSSRWTSRSRLIAAAGDRARRMKGDTMLGHARRQWPDAARDRARRDRAHALGAVAKRASNRIRAMVEGRPDWVISRQRAWGVPIALYRRTARPASISSTARSTRRIVDAFKAGGVDAWFAADHQALLGETTARRLRGRSRHPRRLVRQRLTHAS
jgi:isoleucyl-tRNA synthetase